MMNTGKKKLLEFTVTDKGCFEVTSHLPDGFGYSKIWSCGKQVLLHRFIWSECFGEIPDGMCVCHRCDNPKCICPEHLFLGTQADNMHDMFRKGRRVAAIGERSSCCRLTETDVRQARKTYQQGGTTYKELAEQFGVSLPTMGQAITGVTWSWLA